MDTERGAGRRASLLEKISVILLFCLGGSVVSAAVFARYLAQTKNDASLSAEIGELHALASALGDWAAMVEQGQDEDRGGLAARAREFDARLRSLDRGGDRLRGGAPPLPDELRPRLAELASGWRVLEPALDAVARLPKATPAGREARRRAAPALRDIRGRVDALAAALDARAAALRATASREALAVLVLNGLLCLGALALARRLVILPILRLGEATAFVAAGDFTRRLEVSGEDELSVLVQSFNRMTAEVARLVDELTLKSAALEASADPVCITDADAVILAVNEAFCRQNGWSAAEVQGRKMSILKSGKTDRSVHDDLWRTIRAGRHWTGEVVNRRRDGSEYEALLAVAPVRDGRGRVTRFVSTHHDVTERRALERKLMQSQKLSAAGQLAAGVAHELNNPLGVIMGFADALAQDLGGDADPLALPVRSIQREAARCRDLILDLLTFSRQPKSEERGVVDVRAVVQEALTLVGARARQCGVRLVCDLRPVEAPASRNRLQQVVVNLCNNAIDAMPKGGTLRVSLARALEGGEPRAVLAVSDDGCGMSKEVQARLFEPFFTTKDPGKGTGLGLALVHEIVEKHEGAISIDSAEGRGSTFTVVLPAGTPRAGEQA